jgi:hypothetical protein
MQQQILLSCVGPLATKLFASSKASLIEKPYMSISMNFGLNTCVDVWSICSWVLIAIIAGAGLIHFSKILPSLSEWQVLRTIASI